MLHGIFIGGDDGYDMNEDNLGYLAFTAIK